MDISSKKVIIASHYLVYGASFALKEYFVMKCCKKLMFVAYPLMQNSKEAYLEEYQNGKFIAKRNTCWRTNFNLVNYLLELITTISRFIFVSEKFDLYVGVDPLNALAGVVLKFFGKVRILIYYTIDYVPNRFSNKILNNLYHWIDKICLRFADETWNVSPRMVDGRYQVRGLDPIKYNKQKVVPIGVWFDRVKRLPFSEVKKHQIFFVGHLLEKQGVQLVLATLPTIAKEISDVHFVIAGGGEYEQPLKNIAKNLQIENLVTFLGWVNDRDKLDKLMANSALAVALYDKNTDNFTYYADPTKLKDYLSAGLPIIMTDVPYNARDLEQSRCAVIVPYRPEAIAEKIIELLSDDKILEEYKDNAIKYAQKIDWEHIFDVALENI